MRKASVKVGGVYASKVSNSVVPVRLDEESPHGGWNATNMNTGRNVRIKSAQRLRGPWQEGKAAQQATGPRTGAQGAKKSARTAKDAKVQKKATVAKTGGKGKMSGLDAAAKVLGDATEPLSCRQMVEQMLAQKLWATAGKTPAATIYAAILLEIRAKGDAARFRKVERGRFTLATDTQTKAQDD